ncbi:MatE-like protein [Fragilaria crotonensis]|nr:MatE-like protein [Fragilaria crotonensis]
MSDDGDGFDGYVETTVDPGIWLLLGTCVFCFGVMLILVPMLVSMTLKKRKAQSQAGVNNEQLVGGAKEPVAASFWNIVAFNVETRKILMLAVPYTISALASSTLSNACLILVSKHIGTKAVTAYALVQILVGLTDGMLKGPIYACTTLCAHAVGAGNSFLAGQYIQLSIVLYLLFNAPSFTFGGSTCMKSFYSWNGAMTLQPWLPRSLFVSTFGPVCWEGFQAQFGNFWKLPTTL